MADIGVQHQYNSATIREYYYAALGNDGRQAFQNLDDPAVADSTITAAEDNRTLNFVLDFSDTTAWIAPNLLPISVASLLNTDRPALLNARWINIWHPAQQGALLELLAGRYDFSPRLLALMNSQPMPYQSQSSARSSERSRRRRLWRHSNLEPTAKTSIGKDQDHDELSELSLISSYGSSIPGNIYKIFNDLWHYSSVDFGRNYVCIGYNSLYGTKYAHGSQADGVLPHCTRVWTWLLLCQDSTVISIHEDPFATSQGYLTPLQQRILHETRRNVVNILRSISASTPESPGLHAPMAQYPIRERLGSTPEEDAHRLADVPGLLFYYLFENWQNGYTLITRRESRYGIELNNLREQMFDSPKLCHIDRLDTIGKELGLLKRHYASYNRIIDRLLEARNATAPSLEISQVSSEGSRASLETIHPAGDIRESTLGVTLTSAARVRFQRLRDLIDLYALSEVEEYLKQKDALVAMNFQLIAIKESEDVEKLTRLTFLLTKLATLFLPVSLMTAYFSVPLKGVTHDLTNYWISFAAVIGISTAALMLFGLFSETVQTMDVLRGVGRGFGALGRRVVNNM